MYNPHIPVIDVLTFLARYVGAGNSSDVKDLHGIWTSKRQIQVTMKVDASGTILHPSSSFAIGGSRGYMVYAGQPNVCRTCGKAGHVAASCKTLICRNCKNEGHQTKDCKETKCCNLCGLAGHLYKNCPKCNFSYAQAAKNIAPEEEEAEEHSAPEGSYTLPPTNAPGDSEQVGEEEKPATPSCETPATSSEALPQHTESSNEETADDEAGWETVKKKARKRKENRRARARAETTGKRRLATSTDSSGGSSSDEERREKASHHRHQNKRQYANPQPQTTGSSEATSTALLQEPVSSEVPSAPHLQNTGSNAAIEAHQLETAATEEKKEPPTPGETMQRI
uniref:hepatoma-derived growth factor-related protein 2-like n=1 Tax=Pristiophorus japonicus TaxID=55135 RepID=UPI00398E4B7B